MLHSLKKVSSQKEGYQLVRQTLKDGTAIKKFKGMIISQGVAKDVAEALCSKEINPYKYIPLATKSYKIKAMKTGIIKDIDALKFATVCGNLGAGRQKATDNVDHGVGITLHMRVGEAVEKDKVLAVVHHNGNLTNDAVEVLQESIVIDEEGSSKSLPMESRLIETVYKTHNKGDVFVGQ